MRDVLYWIPEENITQIYSSSYWNDVQEEKKKAWWIGDGEYQKCLDYLKSSGLFHEFENAEKYIDNYDGNNLKIGDIATGIGWTSALLSKNKKVSEIHSVDMSIHRIKELFPHSIKMLSGEEDKIYRYIGSFYDMKFDDHSLDIIFMSQAFHHAENPIKLLIECDRVLKSGGRIILSGEHSIGMLRIIRRFFSVLLREKRISTNFYDLFTADPILGDHYYRNSDYYFMFKSLGYSVTHEKFQNGNVVYIADKN
jgi:ubiquinone/menaquinone biosynthesis C-methylase UbiE